MKKEIQCNFNKYTNALLTFVHSSIVLSAYSYSGSQGAGAGPSIDCRERLEKKTLDNLPVHRWTDMDRALASTRTRIYRQSAASNQPYMHEFELWQVSGAAGGNPGI